MNLALQLAFTLVMASTTATLDIAQDDSLAIPTAPPLSQTDLPVASVSFEKNLGQLDPAVQYQVHGLPYPAYLTHEGLVMDLVEPEPMAHPVRGPLDAVTSAVAEETIHHTALFMHFDGANLQAAIVPSDHQEGRTNYLSGADAAAWIRDVPRFGRVVYMDLYPGIDLAFYSSPEGGLKFDTIVHPGADATTTKMRFEGADSVSMDVAGNLVLATAQGPVVHEKPYTYQILEGREAEVPSEYEIMPGGIVGFRVGHYDPGFDLVIDPSLGLGFSSMLGSSGVDWINDIQLDQTGDNLFVIGAATSDSFPTSPGAYDTSVGENIWRISVSKMKADGSGLVYSTYLSSAPLSAQEFSPCCVTFPSFGEGIAVDGQGNAYITGYTQGYYYPTTAGSFQPVREHNPNVYAAIVTKLDPTGSNLVYSTYLHGNGFDIGRAIAIDGSGNAYVAGRTCSTTFPTTVGAFKTTLTGDCSAAWEKEAFVTKLNPTGSGLVYSTYLGGSGLDYAEDLVVDAAGSAYVAGVTTSTDFPTTLGAPQRTYGGGGDAFVAKINAAGSALAYSTYLGGTPVHPSTGSDGARGIAVDAQGRAYIAGYTSAVNFPTTPGAFQPTRYNAGDGDAFVARFSATGQLDYSTFLGAPGDEYAQAIAVDSMGSAYVAGFTESRDFPVSPQTYQATLTCSPCPNNNAFLVRLAPNGGSLDYGTYLGGNGRDGANAVVVDADDEAYIAGEAGSGFPVSSGAFQTGYQGGRSDGFVAKFTPFPFAGSVASPSHSDAQFYYNETTMEATWSPPSSERPVDGYSYDVVSGPNPQPLDMVKDVEETVTAVAVPVPESFGTFTFRVRALDLFGRWGPTSTFTFNVDSVAPTVDQIFPVGPTTDFFTPIHVQYSDIDGGKDPGPAYRTVVNASNVRFIVDGRDIIANFEDDCPSGDLCGLSVTSSGIDYQPFMPWSQGCHQVFVEIRDTVVGANGRAMTWSFDVNSLVALGGEGGCGHEAESAACLEPVTEAGPRIPSAPLPIAVLYGSPDAQCSGSTGYIGGS